MASPLIIRKGEGKKTIMIGPDPWSFRITGADVDEFLPFGFAQDMLLPCLSDHLVRSVEHRLRNRQADLFRRF
jgi:hypothetical protein